MLEAKVLSWNQKYYFFKIMELKPFNNSPLPLPLPSARTCSFFFPSPPFPMVTFLVLVLVAESSLPINQPLILKNKHTK